MLGIVSAWLLMPMRNLSQNPVSESFSLPIATLPSDDAPNDTVTNESIALLDLRIVDKNNYHFNSLLKE